MDSLIIYFLPTILALGIVTSYEDIKEGKIRNRYIVAGAALSIIIHSSLLLSGIIDLRYVYAAAIYVLAALSIGFFLWLIGIWSEGDAKAYTVYVSLIPLTAYKNIGTSFPAFDLLFNTITPVFFYLLFKMIIKTKTQQKLSSLKKIMNWRYAANIFLIVFGLGWVSSLILKYSGVQTNYAYNLISIMLLSLLFQNILKKYATKALLLIALARIIIAGQQILNYQFLISFAVMTLLYTLARAFLWDLSEFYAGYVSIYKLKEGMILAESITNAGLRVKKSSLWQGFISEKDMLIGSRDPLTKKDIGKIKKAHLTGKLHFNTVCIQQTMPFALFLLVGVIITILCGGSFITFFKTLI